VQTSLTAREVHEVVDERISKGLYALGQRLPPLRSIAAELGTSPSTVSRAFQEMIRNGWLEVQERRFVRVGSQRINGNCGAARNTSCLMTFVRSLPRSSMPTSSSCSRNAIYTTSTRSANSFRAHFPLLSIARTLITDLDVQRLRQNKSVILVPHYHYAAGERHR
jgi:DNA-binding transcriptional regulator YhcF (GntR family)